MKTPCEIIVWEIVPIIRKEIAKSLVKDYKLSQRKTAQKLGITEASVSRYLSGKRGKQKIIDKKILKEIKTSSGLIAQGDTTTSVAEICRICDLLKARGLIKGVEYGCKK
jgi:uncharacterized protein